MAILLYYSTTNAVQAENAMLEFERFARERDLHGAEGVDFDKALGAVYHRLWAVQIQLGKNAEAETNYHLSYDYYERYYKRHGVVMTEADLRNQVAAVDINFGEPNWRTNFGNAAGKAGAQE